MKQRQQKIISAGLVAAATVGGFEALIYILNLNQIVIFLNTAFWIYGYLLLQMAVLFDLHFKHPEPLRRAIIKHEAVSHRLKRNLKIFFSALWNRVEHIHTWKYLKHLLVHLLLPGFIFWSTTAIFYLNFGNAKIQQVFVVLSSASLVANYWFMKEAFSRQKESADSDVFLVLTVVKIYASALLYAACLAIVRRYCLSSSMLLLSYFGFTFLLVYQALFQHKMTKPGNIIMALAIALVMAYAGYGVLLYWGYNYFTAAVLLTAIYNLLWGTFHYHLDRALTKQVFWEIFVVTVLIASMVLSVTNFKAQLLDGCLY